MGPKWKEVNTQEWGRRSLPEQIMFHSIQAEHHRYPITMEDHGEDARAYIYILPEGYIERAVLYIYYRKDAYEIDENKMPYTVITHSRQELLVLKVVERI